MAGIKIWPADKWVSLCVRERAENVCERCGGTGGLSCAHYQGRGAWETRFLPENLWSLCMGCHSYLDSRKVNFKEFFIEKRGILTYDVVVEKSHDIMLGKENRRNKAEIAEHYREEYESMLLKRSYGVTGWLEFTGYQ